MTKVVIKREGLTVEADLSFDQLKELIGVSGDAGNATVAPPLPFSRVSPAFLAGDGVHVNFQHIYGSLLSDRAKKFVDLMRSHPEGVEASNLAHMLGFNTASQIGGLTGPGISKIAERYGISPGDVYRSEITFPGGKRLRMFYPGRLIMEMDTLAA